MLEGIMEIARKNMRDEGVLNDELDIEWVAIVTVEGCGTSFEGVAAAAELYHVRNVDAFFGPYCAKGEGGLDLRDQRRRRPSPLATAAAAAAAFPKSGAGGRCLREKRRRRPPPSRGAATAAVAAGDNGEDDLRLRDK
uniref:Uncharacterized protein n=1 Tax=Caenorhabditis japonica TaxID=281687 RepID=A0A8R1J1R1_CAEJA